MRVSTGIMVSKRSLARLWSKISKSGASALDASLVGNELAEGQIENDEIL